MITPVGLFEHAGSNLPTGVAVDAGGVHKEHAGAFSGTRLLGFATVVSPFVAFYRHSSIVVFHVRRVRSTREHFFGFRHPPVVCPAP